MLVLNNFTLLNELSMPACTTQMTIACEPKIINLFLAVPDTDFHNFLEEVAELPRFAPEIIGALERALDGHALEKKIGTSLGLTGSSLKTLNLELRTLNPHPKTFSDGL